MHHLSTNPQPNAQFRLLYDQADFDRIFYGRDRKDKLLTIAWNRGRAQKVTIDNVLSNFPKTAEEIAYEPGFEDANHFGKFFKKQTGHSPTDFSKLNPLI